MIVVTGITEQIRCSKCNSLLEFNFNDLSIEPIFGHGTKLRITCPECTTFISINRDRINDFWLKKIRIIEANFYGDNY